MLKEENKKLKKELWVNLLSMLNSDTLDKQNLTECIEEDLYFTCQCIVYSKNVLQNNCNTLYLAAAFIAPFISGKEFSKDFYGLWDPVTSTGGLITKGDDMYIIMKSFEILNKKETTKLTNAMKKGFKSALESFEFDVILTYKPYLIDIINLVHPRSANPNQIIEFEGKPRYAIDLIMKGLVGCESTALIVQDNNPSVVTEYDLDHLLKIKDIII